MVRERNRPLFAELDDIRITVDDYVSHTFQSQSKTF